MMRFIIGFFFLLTSLSVSAQILEPVHWSSEVIELGEGEYSLVFTADMDEHWHVYSQFLDTTKIGPWPTTFVFEKDPAYERVGIVEEPRPIKEFDPNFDMELEYFEGKVEFKQKVRLLGDGALIKVGLDYMACDEKQCIFPEPESFELIIGDVDSSVQLGSESAILEPVEWTYTAEKKGEDEYDLVFKASIDEHWHLYSQHLEGFGPVPTSFSFADSTGGFELIGESAEGEPIVDYDPNFEMDLGYFEHEAEFRQRIKVDETNDGTVTGFLTFMVCDDSKCLPPEDIDWKIDLTTGVGAALSSDGFDGMTNDPNLEGRFNLQSVNLDDPVIDCGEVIEKENSLWKIFILGFLGGLIALLTPCVFPMIPLTVSFFTKGSEDRSAGMRKAAIYGLFIFLIYLLLSLPFHLLDGINPDILNSISTNVWLNLVFFVIFIVFAISFFGYFEITLPSSFTNKMDDKAGSVGGMIGIFFMALTLALVSFSCTGPILGSLLAGSLTSDGGAMQLTSGFGGFGLALALPFALFAAFPGWMNSLPQSGGWLNSVKVVLGFAEVALAMKFLSNADLVAHWDLIKIEPFLIVWILCAIGLTLYLFGKLKFPHDSPIKKLSPLRIGFGLAALAFTVYLISGFRYKEDTGTFTSLELLSGLAPPVGYSFIHPSECPHALECFHDFDEGMAHARQVGKPVLLDFTGYACVNCRKMEEHVWPKSEVFDLIRDDYVLISLYVDDAELLPEVERVQYKRKSGRVRDLETVGNKWSTLQTETFNINTQPFYALLSPEGILLNHPQGYTPDVDEYRAFLQCGLDAHAQLAQGQ